MAKLTLSDVGNIGGNPTSAASTINANAALIETALENTLSRDGTSPNEMNANLDMNSNSILNLPAPQSDTEPLRLQDLASFIGGSYPSTASELPFVATGTIAATNVQDAIAEVALEATGVTDGDKGDITVSGSGSTFTIDNDVVTYAKIQNVSATNRLLGRSTAGAGDVEEISISAGGITFLGTPSSANLATFISDETGSGSLVFGTSPTFTTSIVSPLIVGGTGVGSTLTFKSTSGIGSTDAIIFQVGNNGATESLRITTGGNFVIGGTSPFVTQVSGANVTAQSQILAAGSAASFLMGRFSADANPSAIMFAKSRNTTVGSHTVVQSGDRLGRFSFAGSDGTDTAEAARMEVRVDGTPGTGDMPGRFEFSTTPDGAEVPVLALTIDSTQQLKFEAASFTANGTDTVTISNVRPATAATATITKWLTFKDASGVDSYVPVWQ